MGLTHFPNGVSSFGMPMLGGGALTLPVMGGKPSANANGATAFFVDPANGSDGNTGLSPDKALDTVSAAYDKTVDTRGDVIYLLNDGNTSGTSREDSTLTWSNDNTHLVGLCAPTMLSQRARISPSSGNSSIVSPQLNVTGNGNIFSNISLFEGTEEDSTASIGVQVTGARNYFWNVAVMNMGDASSGHSGDEAGSSHVKISGGEENTFEHCYIGLDTVARSAANANVEFESAATRNIFRDCIFPMFADAATPVFVEATSNSDIDRWNLFERCKFINPDTMNAVSTITQAINAVNGSNLGGIFLIYDCVFVGCTDIFNGDSTSIKILGHTQTDTGDIANMMLAVSTDKTE